MAQQSREARPAQATPQERDSLAQGLAPVGQPRSSARRLVGIALLWVALASLVCVPSAGGGAGAALAALGFLAFAAGLSLFADALKREIVASLRAETPR
jgi:hypothetical protein